MFKKILVIWSIIFALFVGSKSSTSSEGKSNITQTLPPKFLLKSEVTVEENQYFAITLESENSNKERITYGIGEGDFQSYKFDARDILLKVS